MSRRRSAFNDVNDWDLDNGFHDNVGHLKNDSNILEKELRFTSTAVRHCPYLESCSKPGIPAIHTANMPS